MKGMMDIACSQAKRLVPLLRPSYHQPTPRQASSYKDAIFDMKRKGGTSSASYMHAGSTEYTPPRDRRLNRPIIESRTRDRAAAWFFSLPKLNISHHQLACIIIPRSS